MSVRVSKNIKIKNQKLIAIDIDTITCDDIEKNGYSCEYLKESEITRLFFDFDYKARGIEDLDSESIKEEYELYMNTIIPVLDKNSVIHDFVYTNGSWYNDKTYKVSFHVIFKSKFIKLKSFNLKHEESKKYIDKIFHGIVNNEIKQDISNSGDDSVYGKKWWFRLPHGGWFDDSKPYVHTIQRNTELKDYFVSDVRSVIDSQIINNDWDSDCLKVSEAHQGLEEKVESPEDIKNEMLEKLEMVKKERFQKYEHWMELFYLIKGQNLPRELFLKYSKESGFKNYSEEDCNVVWYKTDAKKGYGFPLIHKWLEEDGVDWKDIFCKKPLLKTTEEDFSEYIIEALEGEYLYDEIQKTLWLFNKEKALWVQRDLDHIMTLISPILIPIIKSHPIPRKSVKSIKKDDTPEVVKSKFETQKQAFIDETKSYSFQNKVSKLCMAKFKVQHSSVFIMQNFDNKIGIVPIMNNKVINLSTGEVRDRLKTDYFTKIIDRKIVSVSAEERLWIYELFESFLTNSISKIKPNKKHTESLIYSIAYSLTGENNLKTIVNLIGLPDGGKSFFLFICSLIFGNFSGVGNKRVFVESKNESSHDTELFGLLGKRMCSISETKQGQKANEPFLKGCSGNDTMSIRKAYSSENISILLQCILWIATNHPLQTTDVALMRRLVCFNFCNKFQDNPLIKEKILSMADQLFTIICEYAKKYYDNGKKFDIADEVKDYTKYLCDQQNTIKLWITTDKTYEYTENKDNVVERSETYTEYRSFMEGTQMTQLGKIEFYKEFEKHFNLPEATKIKRSGKSFMGYRCLNKVMNSSSNVDFDL